MVDNAPSPEVLLQIRKIIYEKFNDINLRFTNDQIFEILKNEDVAKSITVDDMKPFFNTLHNEGLLRPIAQDFTTQWFKLFAVLEKSKCNSCDHEVYLGKLEDRTCPNHLCKAAI